MSWIEAIDRVRAMGLDVVPSDVELVDRLAGGLGLPAIHWDNVGPLNRWGHEHDPIECPCACGALSIRVLVRDPLVRGYCEEHWLAGRWLDDFDVRDALES